MYPVELRNPKILRPHERTRIYRVFEVLLELVTRKTFAHPIIVDAETNVILDGHHRCQAAKWLRLKSVPCICVPYKSDPSIQVHPRKKTIPISKSRVIEIGLSKTLFPPKTTRHVFPPISCDVYSLDTL